LDILKKIRSRRSIRKFTKKAVLPAAINKILEAGRWAPSGLNNQPWRFMVLSGEAKNALAGFTHCAPVIKSCDKAVLIFLDKKSSYHRDKDLMAVGACAQNMLLCAHSLKLGACWLGEILNRRNELQKHLKIKNRLELQAVIALGRPAQKLPAGKRRTLKKIMV